MTCHHGIDCTCTKPENRATCPANSDATKGKWHGNTDASTAPSTFFYHAASASPDIHPPQFAAVMKRLEELTHQRDGNGDPCVQFIFTRPLHTNPVVAFRFTSDASYRRHAHELTCLGLSLGRGGFNPWRADSHDYEEYVA